MTPVATVHHGEALAWLLSLPEASADALITDPPYSSGGAFRSDRMGSTATKYVTSDAVEQHADFAGDNRDQRAYLTWCTLWLSAAMRVLRGGSPVVLFTDWRQLPTTTDALQAGGFVWRGIGVWHKPSTRPRMGGFTSQAEYAVWGTSGPLLPREEVGCLPGLWSAMSPRERDHQTQKPLEVMAEVVRICPPGGLVLDPFAGSGTTGVACLRTGRRFAGCEITEHYADVARRRLAAEAVGENHRTPGQPALFVGAR